VKISTCADKQIAVEDTRLHHGDSKKSKGRDKAVALRYEPIRFKAPKIVAKGQGKIAERIIKLAKQEGVPIYEDPDLVAALSTLDWYEEIPEQLYRAVAEVLAFAYMLNDKLGKDKGKT